MTLRESFARVPPTPSSASKRRREDDNTPATPAAKRVAFARDTPGSGLSPAERERRNKNIREAYDALARESGSGTSREVPQAALAVQTALAQAAEESVCVDGVGAHAGGQHVRASHGAGFCVPLVPPLAYSGCEQAQDRPRQMVLCARFLLEQDQDPGEPRKNATGAKSYCESASCAAAEVATADTYTGSRGVHLSQKVLGQNLVAGVAGS